MDPTNITNQDWPEGNLSALKVCLLSALEETEKICNPKNNSVFATPNQPMHTGVTRFVAVSQRLDQGCKSGLLRGITAHWRQAQQKNGFYIFELHGANTEMIVCHISDMEDSPRDCAFRSDWRTGLQQVMSFIAEGQGEREKLKLTLVYGGKRGEEFAFIRGYYDPAKPTHYIDLTGNIMNVPFAEPSADQEDIQGPNPDIKEHLRDDEDETGEQAT